MSAEGPHRARLMRRDAPPPVPEHKPNGKDKDETIRSLRRQLDTAANELKKYQSHSKDQSKELVKLKDAKATVRQAEQREAAAREEMEQLRDTITKIGGQLHCMEQENDELRSQAQLAKSEAEVYKEDFKKERQDRALAKGRLESLERNKGDSKALEENMKGMQKEIKQLQRELSAAKEEVQLKVSQVKQYKKQVDGQNATISKLDKEKQALALQMAQLKKEKNKLHVQADKEKKKEQKQKEKELRAKKKEQEKQMIEDKEKRKSTMLTMDARGKSVYLEDEVTKLEEEKYTQRKNLDILEATCNLLADKLNEAEVRMIALEKDNTRLSVYEPYMMNPQRSVQETRPGARNYVNLTSSGLEKDTPMAPVAAYTTQHNRGHSQARLANHPVAGRKNSVTSPQLKAPILASNDPALFSKDVDYVNDPKKPALDSSDPALYSKTSEYVNLLPPSPSPKRLHPSTQPRTPPLVPPKPPRLEPQPHRPASVGSSEPMAKKNSNFIHNSLPNLLSGENEEDISDRIDNEIQQEASDMVLSAGPDEHRYSLKHVPFDPYLKCLYCSKMFRYGEIQKYKKHVNSCTELVS